MSKSFLFLFACFLLLLAAYFYIKTLPIGKSISQMISPTQKPTTSATALLSFSPNELTLTASQSGSINVLIYAEGAMPTTVQLELAYNPYLLQNITLAPGDFFSDPAVVLNTNDINTGRISYAIQRSGNETMHSGVVARINLTPVNTFFPLLTAITFLPKTVIKDQDGKTIPIATSEATLQLVPALLNQQASKSAGITQLRHPTNH